MQNATWEKLPIIHCSGNNASEIGFSHGKQLRDRIACVLNYYSRCFQSLGLGADVVQTWGEGYQREVSAFAPELAVEISAIAQGAGRASWELFALNARSEIIAHGFAMSGKLPPGECTCLYCPMAGLLAQNWDWDLEIESLPVLLRIPRHEGTPSILTMTEPGMVAKVGLNDCGLGVCLNFLSASEAPTEPIGLPVHCLLRQALSCESLVKAHALLRHAPRHCTCHILLADSIMQYRMLEFVGAAVECAGADSSANQSSDETPIEGAEWQLMPPSVVVHTNHYLHPSFAHLSNDNLCHSQERYQRVLKVFDESDCESDAGSARLDDIRLVKMALGDRAGAPKAILFDDAPGFTPQTGKIGTICSMIMDLRSHTMHVTRGRAMAQDYVPVSFMNARM